VILVLNSFLQVGKEGRRKGRKRGYIQGEGKKVEKEDKQGEGGVAKVIKNG
jgi:hypothetical protein